MSTLAEGDTAPDFTLPASRDRTASLSSLRGKPVVVYFYPKADTSGCTKEACAFQEALPALGKSGLTVIGISRDKMKAIDAFADKYALDFPLASDENGTVSEAYGTWIEKSMYGRSYMGLDRATFLIDAEGHIARIWRKVKVTGHVKQVTAAAAEL
ncbi:thioredoxin-dependent thiol peroxidase [Granulibacter bethesdensis]|uniref:thioredoxin-dependent thiol peroxidase n=1 Tax=Granulibacter bethesdensis TaxID=364410 RepID=UPI0002FCBD6F|nr:thioredoxin-dependent thiol peroxidase [Granulibacter bethesdensis]